MTLTLIWTLPLTYIQVPPSPHLLPQPLLSQLRTHCRQEGCHLTRPFPCFSRAPMSLVPRTYFLSPALKVGSLAGLVTREFTLGYFPFLLHFGSVLLSLLLYPLFNLISYSLFRQFQRFNMTHLKHMMSSCSRDTIRKRWDETKGLLTREWKKRAREAVKLRKRRYGAQNGEDA